MTLFQKFRNLMIDQATYEKIELIQEQYVDLEKENHELLRYYGVLEKIVSVPQNASPYSSQSNLGSDVFKDLEVFKSNDESIGTSIIDSVRKWNLMGSELVAKSIITHPACTPSVLNARQENIKRVSDAWSPEMEHLFKQAKHGEKDFLWLFETNDTNLDAIYELVFFTGYLLKYLNKSAPVLTGYNIYRMIWSPLIGVTSPIVYFIVPYLIMRIKLGVKINFISYLRMMFSTMFNTNSIIGSQSTFLSRLSSISYALSMLFYFQNVFTSIEISKATYRLSKLLVGHVNGIIKFIKSSHKLVSTLWKDEIAQSFSIKVDPMPECSYFQEISPSEFSVFSNFGKQLSIFRTIKKEMFIPLVNRVYILDVLTSIGRTVAQDPELWTFPIYRQTEKPYLKLSNVYHPCLPSDSIVKNDIILGSSDSSRNMIITGPNAGGKSTIIKSIMISTLLSQTICITNASSCTMTPFSFINTQINIPDCKGKRSLFEAEMYRAKENIDAISTLAQTKGRAIIAIDEIFNSTNPIEGISGGYAIAKKLSQNPNVISIISTHFIYLTKLASEEGSTFVRYKMNVNVDENGHVVDYPYKLVQGISRQYIALELLKKNGFDEDIIEEAIAIKKRLIKKPHKDE